jgi:hypothetical protein
MNGVVMGWKAQGWRCVVDGDWYSITEAGGLYLAHRSRFGEPTECIANYVASFAEAEAACRASVERRGGAQ